jgi:Ca2+-transporting ATPase
VQIITLIAVGMGTIVFLLSHWLVGVEVRESFIFAVGIIVANVPEGLLPLVTLTLAIGVQRMARRNALVRRLSAVETLSATTVICTDKTGTLTKNEMTVHRLWLPGDLAAQPGSVPALTNQWVELTGVGYTPEGTVKIPAPLSADAVNLLLGGAALCSNAHLSPTAGRRSGTYLEAVGDPTEAALLVAALKADLHPEALQKAFPRLREVPFDSRRRLMTVVVQRSHPESLSPPLASLLPSIPGTYLSFSKGAIGEILRCCRFVYRQQQFCPLTDGDRDEITAANDALASQGSRVLGVALRLGGTELMQLATQDLEQNFVFVGLVAMVDPPRPEVPAAIAACHRAGIGVTMVTGDYRLTAAAIASQIGLTSEHLAPPAKVLTGEDLEQMSDAQLRQILHNRLNFVFARMMPEQKLRLVQAYKDLGNIVAVTGDGVNDAPALRAAHIGIAMGQKGTDVAREAADIVLLDDNFATIVQAIEQGRGIYQNIRNFMVYILSSNIPEVVPFLGMIFAKIPPALTIMQILAIDLGTDMVPALALGAEQAGAEVMSQPPRDQRLPLLDWSLLLRAYGFLGVIEAIFGMTAFLAVWAFHGYSLTDLQQTMPAILAHKADPATTSIYIQSITLTLVSIVAGQVGNLFACRSEVQSIFQFGFFSNRLIWIGLAVEMVLLLAIVYFPPLQRIFSTMALGYQEWLPLLFCPLLLIGAEEMRKRFVKRQLKV